VREFERFAKKGVDTDREFEEDHRHDAAAHLETVEDHRLTSERSDAGLTARPISITRATNAKPVVSKAMDA
jgi:hypothetical protein